MRYEHVDDVSLHTYIDTYIHRYSEFAICYSCIRGSLRLAPNYYYVWYVRHARTAIDIVQRCAVYFKRPHENICVSMHSLDYGPYTHRSNLANCKFTLVPALHVLLIKCKASYVATVARRARLQRRRERDRARRQLNNARIS